MICRVFRIGIVNPASHGYEEHAVDSLGKYAEYRYYNHDASVSLRFIREKYQLSAGMSFNRSILYCPISAATI